MKLEENVNMTTDVIMPKLGLTMKEGTIVEWLKKEGDAVEKGEPIVEVETEKISNVVEAPASGVLLKILASKGTVVPVTGIIAIVGELGEEIVEKAPQKAEQPKIEAETEEVIKTVKPSAPQFAEEKIKISPLARKLAQERGVDIATIEGTGPEGRIVREDILKAAETVAPSTAGLSAGRVEVSETVALTGTRKTIADRLSQSYHSAVHTTVITEVDMNKTVELRQSLLSAAKEKTGASLTYTGILVKAVAMALRKHPFVNSTLEGDTIKVLKSINVGVAIDAEEGLIVPVIREADRKTLFEIAPHLAELADKARKKSLSMEEVSSGTFTITNLGMLGVSTFVPIINPPQAAILGVGKMEQRPVVIDGKIEVRTRVNLSLVFDHRIVDGAEAARFLQTLKDMLENPSTLHEKA
jgi:pyruvate dehydrogenase E2 component (dihydrolipoamide acetyltransferase)